MPEQLLPDSSPEPAPRLRVVREPRRASTSYGPKDDVIGAREVHLLDYVRVVYKRRWTAITVFLLVFGTVTVYTFTATPIFEAKARLLIETEERNVVSFKQVVDEDQTRVDYYQTQYNILQSRVLARRTLDQLKLWDTQPFGGAVDSSFSFRRTLLGAPAAVAGLFRKSDDKVAPNQMPGADETTAQARAIDIFIGHLAGAPIRNSRLVDLKYQLPDPVLATSIVNALARNYILQNLEYKFTAVERSERLARRAAGRGAAVGRKRRSEAAAISRAERRDLAHRPREHHGAEAGRSQRGA